MFCNRQQRVTLAMNDETGEWLNIIKGAPQGSLFGPFGYNVFSNDLLFLMKEFCDIYNYADDNTISCYGMNVDEAKCKISIALDVMLNWFENNGLKANPEKFQMILFQRQQIPNDECVKVNDISIPNQMHVKLLGVYIDSKLDFNIHIHEICKKAGYKLNVLSRLSRQLDESAKLLLLHSFILSYFNYCSVVWHFCNTESTKKIEKIKKRALRYVYKYFSSSYECLREKCNLPLVYTQRLRYVLLEVYKVYHKLGPLYLHDLFSVQNATYNLRKDQMLFLPRYTTVRYGTNSFSYQGIKLWNDLDNKFKIMNYKEFKESLSTWLPKTCHCSNCILCKLFSL